MKINDNTLPPVLPASLTAAGARATQDSSKAGAFTGFAQAQYIGQSQQLVKLFVFFCGIQRIGI